MSSRSRKPRGKQRGRSKPKMIPSRQAEVTIFSLGAQGDGLADLDGTRLYVPFSLPGERVSVRTGQKHGDGLDAELVEVLEPSPERVEPPCPYFGSCGGCTVQHLSDQAYLDWKLSHLSTTLKRGGLDGVEMGPLHRTPLGARRRVNFALHGKKLGFHGKRSHGLVNVETCLLLTPDLNALIEPLRLLMRRVKGVSGVSATSTRTGVDVLLEGEESPDMETRERLAEFADEHDLARMSWQSDYIEPVSARRVPVVRFAGVDVALPPGAFLQPSAEGEAAIAQAVMDGVGKAKSVADLYCGLGSFTFPVAEGRTMHAVEGAEELLGALKVGADNAQLINITTETRDLAQRPLLSHELEKFEAVVFDPPRAGAKSQAEQLAISKAAKTIVAVSCNPSTFLRDARTLLDAGYTCTGLTPIDQFPYTGHLEVVAVFAKDANPEAKRGKVFSLS